jgi:hypothetical protein
MKVYTYSEARQQLATVLEQAGREGGVRIRRRDGEVFVLRPERAKGSPLEVPGLNLRLTRKEIVEFVRAGRKPTSGKSPRLRYPARRHRRVTS